jgi:hypothetical protein
MRSQGTAVLVVFDLQLADLVAQLPDHPAQAVRPGCSL